ncbi:RloB family protein [Bifidobacterium catulorum]|uniref:RloB domain-containing protein n=1 Tax=Bifidobacterium catulorum TaxID=1630173 RepID=A0A2U2MQ65_9BIFI|nr:RloB family protein [Bifidobacterium catulorum]PWG58992.1 RloB domain-containing protein [Bifidobacterium catulorum]
MSRKKTVFPAHGRNARRRHRRRTKRYLVVCGGEVTERLYFERLALRNNVTIDVQSKKRSPSQLAQYAVALKQVDDRENDRPDRYSAIFVVVDVDDFHDHGDAQRICRQNSIQLVISNPCFEVWLIDHVRPCPDSYDTTSYVEDYAAELKVVTGQRNKYIDFSYIDGHLRDAIENAKRHNTDTRLLARRQLAPNHEVKYAPWTDMVDVVNSIIRPTDRA